MREKVALVCEVCLSRNYFVEKKKGDASRAEIKKFCPKCNKHTMHKETR